MKLQDIVKYWRSAGEETGSVSVVEPGETSHARAAHAGNGSSRLSAWLSDGRYCRLLEPEGRSQSCDGDLATAWMALEAGMAFVPGPGIMRSSREWDAAGSPAERDPEGSTGHDNGTTGSPVYLDRYAVTNSDYLHFVVDGGYDLIELWPQESWQHVVQFVDGLGCAGPRFWRDGRPPRGRDRHPVVGVCRYEAQAYALWAGKRLPSAEEWEAAASWSAGADGRETEPRFPWGNAFSPDKANLWASGHGGTVEVDRYPAGSTPNGIYQLIGNVWEWVAGHYLGPQVDGGGPLCSERAMAEIRGGAFDTYFESQATCRFRTGQPFLYRGPNVGFRCAVGTDRVGHSPDPSAFFNSRKSS